jgi:hypothetical protein
VVVTDLKNLQKSDPFTISSVPQLESWGSAWGTIHGLVTVTVAYAMDGQSASDSTTVTWL